MGLETALTAFKNIQFSNSVLAGGAASVLVYAAGAMLVSMNVMVPFIGVPLTMAMVGAFAIPAGHLITAIVPDSVKQSISALAAKLPKLQARIPSADYKSTDFPHPPSAALEAAVANQPLTKADAAMVVIAAHASGYPTGVNGK